MKKKILVIILSTAVLTGTAFTVSNAEDSPQAMASGEGAVTYEAASDLKNADDAPLNSIIQISADDCVENTPYGTGVSSGFGAVYSDLRSITGYLNGTLTTTGSSDESKYQIFVSTGKQGPEPTLMFYRYCNDGTWSEWHNTADQVSASSANIAIRKVMIARYLDAEGNPTAEDTGIENPQYMADDPRIFSDFNNAPLHSIYQIDRDCDSSVMANNPMSGRSCVLITTGYSYASRHATIQLCVGLSGGQTLIFYRYEYIKDDVGTTWSAWEKITTSSAKELTLAAGTSEEVTISASQLQAMIDELSAAYGAITSGVLEIAPSGIEQGSWAYSSKADSSSRLRSAVSYKIPYGTSVIFTNPSLKLFLGLLKTPSAEEYVQLSHWIDPGQEDAEITFWDDGYLNIILESPDGTQITPEDYDCSIKIIYN